VARGPVRRTGLPALLRLAGALGVPVGTLREWEQGRRLPSLRGFVAVARGLGLSLDEPAGLVEALAPKKGKGK
jgi:transcriptional regulator with XRE-family HTH domain